MSETATGLLQQVLQLPEDERTAFAGQVLDSLSEASYATLFADDGEDPEFEAEIARRSDSLHDGTAVLIDAAEALAEVREQLRRKRER